MALKPEVKNAWIEFQKKSSDPVNAIGVKIPAGDSNTLKSWKEEGIDQYLKK